MIPTKWVTKSLIQNVEFSADEAQICENISIDLCNPPQRSSLTTVGAFSNQIERIANIFDQLKFIHSRTTQSKIEAHSSGAIVSIPNNLGRQIYYGRSFICIPNVNPATILAFISALSDDKEILKRLAYMEKITEKYNVLSDILSSVMLQRGGLYRNSLSTRTDLIKNDSLKMCLDDKNEPGHLHLFETAIKFEDSDSEYFHMHSETFRTLKNGSCLIQMDTLESFSDENQLPQTLSVITNGFERIFEIRTLMQVGVLPHYKLDTNLFIQKVKELPGFKQRIEVDNFDDVSNLSYSRYILFTKEEYISGCLDPADSYDSINRTVVRDPMWANLSKDVLIEIILEGFPNQFTRETLEGMDLSFKDLPVYVGEHVPHIVNKCLKSAEEEAFKHILCPSLVCSIVLDSSWVIASPEDTKNELKMVDTTYQNDFAQEMLIIASEEDQIPITESDMNFFNEAVDEALKKVNKSEGTRLHSIWNKQVTAQFKTISGKPTVINAASETKVVNESKPSKITITDNEPPLKKINRVSETSIADVKYSSMSQMGKHNSNKSTFIPQMQPLIPLGFGRKNITSIRSSNIVKTSTTDGLKAPMNHSLQQFASVAPQIKKQSSQVLRKLSPGPGM